MAVSFREFDLWLRSAARGEKLTYFRGCLTTACGEGVANGQTQARLRETRAAAMAAFRKGDVQLVQRRNGVFDYDYLAVKV